MRNLILSVMMFRHYLLYEKKPFIIYYLPFSIQKIKHYQPLWGKVHFSKLLESLLLMPLVPFFPQGTVYIFTTNTIFDGSLKTKNTGRLNINLHIHSKRKATKQMQEGIGLYIIVP